MNEHDFLAQRFETQRPHLRSVAYRILGSRAEAEDAVQETWLRLARTDHAAVDNLAGWLTTVVGRVCLDRLRERRSRHEQSAGLQLVEDEPESDEEHDPAQQTLLAESLGAALLVVLEQLAPAERVAFVLHDVFAVPFDDIAEIVERSPAATRQLASRARRRVQGQPETGELDLVRQRRVVDAFLRAARGGDFEGLIGILDPDVVLRPDAAALSMGSLGETHGATAVADSLAGGAQTALPALVDGIPALVWAVRGEVRAVIEFTLDKDKIAAINVAADPTRIGQLDIVITGK